MLILENICKSYSLDEQKIDVLNSISLEITQGEICSVIGVSGSGKTTLLNIMGLLDRPTSGRILYRGQDITHTAEPEQAKIRNQQFGFIFQSFNLLPRLSAIDNVGLPLMYRGLNQKERRRLAYPLLERVGLADRVHHHPNELSGGQRQRVAIARALVGKPQVIFADEPTGNLDIESTQNVLGLLDELNRDTGVSIVVVTHDPKIGQRYGRQIIVSKGTATALDSSSFNIN